MKKVIIVGAGISGLAAGIYARQSGFETVIYESHSIPGGASTSWRRKGYLFEGGMHWLTGSSEKTQLNRLWREVGALDESVKISRRDPFFNFRYQGKTASLYRDLKALRQHFLSIAPEDKKEIDRLCRDVRLLSSVQMPAMDIKGVKVKNKTTMSLSMLFSMMPALPRMAYYAKFSCKEYAARFKNETLRLLLENIIGEEYSASGMVFTIATLTSGDGGYPEGGSLAMAGRMAKYFLTLGGSIVYRTPVEKVSVVNGIADGVIIGGEQIPADAVIVTRDTLSAIDTMFDEPIREPWAEQMRRDTIPMLDTFVGLGVEADLSSLPENLMFRLNQPIVFGGIPVSVIGFNNYAGFHGYAPEGCTALTAVVMGDSYAFWKNARENGTYEDEKRKFAEAYIEALSQQVPQIRGKVAVWDVATPLTYERYLGSFKGSWMTYMKKGQGNISYPCKPETIKNVYFAGQRLRSPGGLPVALTSGRTAVQYLCLDADTVFQGNL
ncbi:MAG: NAD(P)/FAD-dependent oxidoreductase [Clostridiaceae bacterium]